MTKQELIDKFNEGDFSFLKYFGDDAGIFVRFLRKREYIEQLFLEDLDNFDTTLNQILLELKKFDYELFVENILKFLEDLSFENGKFYVTTEAEDLSKLFCSGRNDISNSVIDKVLSGDYGYEAYDWYQSNSDDWYSTIRGLNKENLTILYNKIFSILKDVQISPETDELESIAQSQGHPEYVSPTETNIIVMLKDSDTRELLFDEYLSDLKQDLSDVYRYATESSYNDSLYDEIWSGLSSFFPSKEYTTKKYGNKDYEYIKLEIFDFNHFIEILLKEGNYSCNYFGSIIGFMQDTLPCLHTNPNIYGYASDETINEYFKDNIH